MAPSGLAAHRCAPTIRTRQEFWLKKLGDLLGQCLQLRQARPVCTLACPPSFALFSVPPALAQASSWAGNRRAAGGVEAGDAHEQGGRARGRTPILTVMPAIQLVRQLDSPLA